MSKKKDDSSTSCLVWKTIAGVLFILIAYGGIVSVSNCTMESRGQFGDMFGGANALFSGLAFAAIFYTLHLQQKEMTTLKEHHDANIKIMNKQLEIETIKLRDSMLPILIDAGTTANNKDVNNRKTTSQKIKNFGHYITEVNFELDSEYINNNHVELKFKEDENKIWHNKEDKILEIYHDAEADKIMFFYIFFSTRDGRHWKSLCQLALERGLAKSFLSYPPEETPNGKAY
tara:strand:- start:870 stop:1562 length:693 start_codon:yes stop_codon:yes gene_type:complete